MLLETVGIGLIVGSCGTLCSHLFSLSSSSSFKSLLQLSFQSLQLGIKNGDSLSLPVINKDIDYGWGKRFLVNLPTGLSSHKVIEQTRAISEALRADVDIYFQNGLIIDVYKAPLPSNVPYEALKRSDWKVPIGINRRGETRFYDFSGSFPHLLIAGISGGGKSVMMRNILTTLILNQRPEFYLCDLKGGVELGLYKDFTCTKGFATKFNQALELAGAVESEMNKRYQIMYNNGSQEWHGNKILMVMDELADLKTRQGDPDNKIKNAIKTKLTNLSAKGRAAGVNLLLATQRPSADIIDGLIKTNIASSICFRTRDAVQSRIVLDHDGAAALPDVPGRCIFQQARDETLQTFYLSYEQAKKLLNQVERNEQHESRSKESMPLDGNTLELG